MNFRIGRIWVMLNRIPGSFRRIKAEPPCMKGEVVLIVPTFRVVIGWQA
jgi:hypothetical protein